jgi:hypothetical protein
VLVVQLEEDSEAGGMDTLLHRAGVFARMSPDDKRLLVELLGEGALTADGAELPGLGNYVGEAMPARRPAGHAPLPSRAMGQREVCPSLDAGCAACLYK